MTTATASRRGGARRSETSAVVPPWGGVTARHEIVERPSDARAVDLESLSADWQRALDAAGTALQAAGESLPSWELRDRRVALAREVETTAAALRELASGGRQPAPWLSPTPVTNRMLGLSATVRACIFDVEGVLTDSSVLHAWAWGEVFDDFLLRLGHKTGWHLIPFDRVSDYRAYVEARSRLEGIHAFLDSRGIHVPEGRPGELNGVDTAQSLARRKGVLLERRLRERGVTALPGARRYLEAARRAGLSCAVIYESASTLPVLEQSGLAGLIDALIDAAVISSEGLRSRPAPDLLLAACRRLDIAPAQTVTFTSTPAGAAAGKGAGMLTIGVGDQSSCETLEGFGADGVTPSLSALLDPRLRAV